MSRHIALLRGINVGGTGLIKMDVLRKLFAAAGAKDVSTYIASGNVIFSAPARDLPAIRRGAQKRLNSLLGENATTVFRRAEDVHAIVARDPFKKFRKDGAIKTYVLFLEDEPSARLALPFRSDTEMCEVFAFDGPNLYVVSRQKPNGWYGFPNNWLEKVLDVRSTARTWNTVAKLAALTQE